MTGALLAPEDVAQLRDAYPMMELEPLTAQQEQAILYHLRGLSATAAATEAGFNSKKGVDFLRSPKAQAILHYLRQQQVQQIAITRDMLNAMLIDAHRKAANTTEEVMAIKELGKLNDLYPAEKKRIEQTTRHIQSEEQLERLDEGQLMELSGEIIDLEPEEVSYIDEDGREVLIDQPEEDPTGEDDET